MEQKEKVLKNLTVTVKDDFHPTYEVEMITATDLAKTIDTLFGRVFNDYHRCNLNPVQSGQFNGAGSTAYDLSLSFRPNANAVDEADDSGKVAAFIPAVASAGNTANAIYNSMKKVSNTAKLHTVFNISQTATEILRNLFIDNFVFADPTFTTDPSPKKYVKCRLIGEQQARVNIGYNRFTPVVENVILHLDINKVLQLIMGDTNEKGEKMFYSIRPLTEIYANIPNSAGLTPIRSETIIEILRLNGVEWDNFNARIGASQKSQEVISPIRIVQ